MYWLIEPEISSSATIGGAFAPRPEIFEIDHRAAGLEAGAQGAAHVDEVTMTVRRKPPRLHLVERQHEPLDRLLGGGDLGRRHLREVLLLQHLAVGHGQPRVDLDVGRRPLLLAEIGEQRLLDALRAGLRLLLLALAAPAAASRPAACRDSRGGGRRCGTPGRTAASARAASRTPRAASSRNPRACRRRPPAPRQRIQHRAGTDRNTGGPQRAREVDDVLGEPAAMLCCRLHHVRTVPLRGEALAPRRHSAARSSARTSSSSSFALLPSMRAMSS